MRKGMLVATMVAIFVACTSLAFAEGSSQFRLPMQVTRSAELKDINGQGYLLTFDLANNMSVGILSENIDFVNNTIPLHDIYSIYAFRISKTLAEPITVGVDFGTAHCGVGNTEVYKNVADIFGGVKLLTSRGGKITTFLNVELLYRFLKTDQFSAGVKDFSGTMVNVGAGINF